MHNKKSILKRNTEKHAAKFAFFYLLSLVTLLIMSLSTGSIIFQIINKEITDLINEYSGRFSLEQVKFAISALLISTPLYFVTMKQIQKSLRSGELHKDSETRKWLSYFVLLVSSVVMIGWLIGVMNSFLSGELTSKFALKALTALTIAATIFSFYLYDIKRDIDKKKKDKVVCWFSYLSLLAVAIVFIASLFVVESPRATRNRKLDNRVIDNLQRIDNSIDNYYHEFKKMPLSLTEVVNEYDYLSEKIIQNINTKKEFDYQILGERKYRICTDFYASNKDDQNDRRFPNEEWKHNSGYYCFEKRLRKLEETKLKY